VIENFRAGVEQTRMDRVPGLENVLGTKEPITVARVEPISSLSGVPDYYLLTLTTAAGGLYALGAVSKEGWLMGVFPAGRLNARPSVDIEEARALFDRQLGLGRATRLRRVHVRSTFSSASSEFFPVVVADTPGGIALVNHRRRVFVEAPSTQHQALIEHRRTGFEEVR
jgi:hypothetical protein